MKIFFISIFIIATLICSIMDIKTRKKVGVKKVLTICIYLYLGITMGITIYFIDINYLISIVIFLHLMLISSIYNLTKNKNKFSLYCLLVAVISGLTICLSYLFNKDPAIFLWIILGISLYILPGLGYIDRIHYTVDKIKRCTEKVDATIIKVYKSAQDHGHIYIPVFEFSFNSQQYKFMDSYRIYSKRKFKVGDTVCLYVNPNGIKLNYPNGSDDIFFPDYEQEQKYHSSIIIWYIIITIILILVAINIWII